MTPLKATVTKDIYTFTKGEEVKIINITTYPIQSQFGSASDTAIVVRMDGSIEGIDLHYLLVDYSSI